MHVFLFFKIYIFLKIKSPAKNYRVMVHFVQKTKNIQQNITFSAYNFVPPTAPVDDKFVSHR